MNFRTLFTVLAAALFVVDVRSIDHDKVQPFAQPEAVTVSEKNAVKFKPQMFILERCASFPAVNAAGEITGGLKGSGGDSGCKVFLLGSQVYGRDAWYEDVWAIMYAWYFPKGFWTTYIKAFPTRRHDWANAIVWINNPDSVAPEVVGLSLSDGDNNYKNRAPAPFQGTTPRLFHNLAMFTGQPYLDYTIDSGEL